MADDPLVVVPAIVVPLDAPEIHFCIREFKVSATYNVLFESIKIFHGKLNRFAAVPVVPTKPAIVTPVAFHVHPEPSRIS